jgi:hypothetical protein
VGRELIYDVVVVGGGSAGLAAALCASRTGARVALVERYGFLGGMATGGMVGTVCGLYHTSTEGPPRLLNDGLCAEFAERLASRPGCEPPVRRGRTYVLPYSPFAFACLADELTQAEERLDVYLHSTLTGASTRGERASSVRLSRPSSELEVAGRAFVDATGDAVLCRSLGLPTETAPPSLGQLPSLVFVLQGVDHRALERLRGVGLLRRLAAAEAEDRLPEGASHLSFRLSANPGEVVAKLALSGISVAERDRRDPATWAEQEGRRRAAAVAAFLRQALPEFRQSFVSHSAPHVGVREGGRVLGRYRLTREDVLEGRRFDDAVARAAWPIELWREGERGARYEYLEDGASYDIPLRALRPARVENVFVAGRCMSGTSEALGSARMMGTCLAVGAAVGEEAARVAEAATP